MPDELPEPFTFSFRPYYGARGYAIFRDLDMFGSSDFERSACYHKKFYISKPDPISSATFPRFADKRNYDTRQP